MSFDPTAPLPGAPDPWVGSEMPAWRDGPPYAMTEMIAAEPALAGRLVARLQADPALERIAGAIRDAIQAGRPVTTTGCGTSQHAAIAVAHLIADGLGRQPGSSLVRAVQAFELAGRPPDGGAVVAISHEGGTDATNQALRWGGGPEGPTALITVSDRSPGAAIAGDVLATGEQDQSWCHTVGYLSPLVVGACLHAALLGTDVSAEAVERQVAVGTDEATADRLAGGLVPADRLLIVGSGADYAAARELALKVEEGARVPAVAHELETIRHGHLAAATERTGLVVFLTDAEGRAEDVRDRAATSLRAAAELGMPSVLIGSSDMAEVAAGASVGSQLVPLDPNVSRPVAAILGVVTPLQLLTERLARARGTNPDSLGREDPRQAAAAEA
jgi:glucosamine--fructose-6-phosphate aminotransferase (isomerizing)